MAQFAVYRNRDSGSKSQFPLLLDVQSDLFDELATRVVVPLTKASSVKKTPLERLTPVITVLGEDYVLLTPQLAGVANRHLGPAVSEIPEQRAAIIAALDMLVTGT